MMLCKLSLKNIKKSFKDYAIYFFTLILGVSIFYVFNAIDSQTVMMNVSASTKNIIKLMTQMLSGLSVFVSFILGFLIIYASRFLIKRRNKEFGIYLTLGMSKKKISTLLLLETIFIGIISLLIGLGLGIILSQFMSILVANSFEADLREFAFTFSSSSCIKTIIYFSIMYLFVMLFNTVMIGKCKLIDLLASSKKSEEVKLKNPYICILVFILAIFTLGRAYYMVTVDVENLDLANSILKPVIMGAVSTFFIFWSLSGLILKIVRNIKRVYYKGLNSFVLRQISSKINTTVMSMTMICLMLFVTICVLSSALSIKNSMTHNLKTLAPVDIEFEKNLNLNEEEIKSAWNLTEAMMDDSKISLKNTLNKLEFNIEENLKETVNFLIYQEENLTMKETLGTYYEEAKKEYPRVNFDSKEDIITLSDYNKIANLYHLEEVILNENEYIIIADFDSLVSIRNEGLKRNTSINISEIVYYPKYQECQKGFIYISSNHINTGIIIVPDEAVKNLSSKKEIIVGNYNRDNEEEKKEIEAKVLSMADHEYIKKTSLNTISKLSIYESSIGLGALATFIGLYLGVIFLISSAALLALKELSESTDNYERFKILRKIGAEEHLINQALFKQIAIFFLFPLILAIIHSIFGIMFCNYILATFGGEQLLVSIIMTSIFIVFIYGGYFIITYFCSKNILKERY